MNRAFTHITLSAALVLIGLSLIPFLPFQLYPTRSLPSMTITYNWSEASAEVIEQVVTSPLEGALATLQGLAHVQSTTVKGRGTIRLDFAESEDLDFRRFEASALIRQIVPDLPQAVSYPTLTLNRPKESREQTLMSFTLNGNAPPALLKEYAEMHIRIPLSQIQGIEAVAVYGASPFVWELAYDPEQLHQLKLSVEDIRNALERSVYTQALGHTHDGKRQNYQPIILEGGLQTDIPWEQIPVKQIGGRILYLTDLVTIQYREQNPDAYYRLNGLNTLNIKIDAAQLANQLAVAQQLEGVIAEIRASLPAGYSLVKTYDATSYLREELEKIGYRSLFTVMILLVFVALISRSWRYLTLIIASLTANLAVACVGYYFLELEMHLYSLAGITVSLGLIIDNSIVMIDHLRHQGNKRVFLAILAATLTTLGALSVIFFLPQTQQIVLVDFAWVMMINLLVSLAVALWLIPALMHKLPLATRSAHLTRSYLTRIIRLQRPYRRWIYHSLKWRPLWLTLAILGFGLPVFWLPDHWGAQDDPYYYGTKEEAADSAWYARWYDQTLGSRYYQQQLKPWVDKSLGGALRLFVEETYPNAQFGDPGPTTLYVRGRMAYGTTVGQMNEAYESLENFLAQFEEIKQYETHIQSSQSAEMTITFKEAYDKSAFPYFLKSRIESEVIDLGAVDWQVYGVGRGFNNAIGMGTKNSRIQMRGYNYDKLVELSEELKTRLLRHPRIKEVFLNGEIRWDYRPNSEYIVELDAQQLGLKQAYGSQLLSELQPFSLEETPVFSTFIQGKYDPVVLVPQTQEAYDIWHIQQLPIALDSTQVTLRSIADIRKIPAGEVIYREAQQYHIWVEYDFIGPDQLRRKVLKQMAEDTQQMLPVGYTAEVGSLRGWFGKEAQAAYGLIFLVIVIIYAICAILLESLRQPLAVIAMIPISFIGVFLTFYLFSFDFDQGGYASFLLLSGLSVNAALYIINDYNHFRKQRAYASSVKSYLAAFRHKSVPISLTILSTIVGLIPFVWGGQDDPFWFALAVGTMGGLVFSLIAVVGYLPMLVLRRR